MFAVLVYVYAYPKVSHMYNFSNDNYSNGTLNVTVYQ